MKNWPTDPMAQHNLLIAALCEDIIETGKVSLDGPKTSRVAEINRQVTATVESRDAHTPPEEM
jgi:hypothetical protein